MGNPKTYLNGKKISSGGSTTVIANPTGIATETLEKIQIGNVIYSIPSGGGGGNIENAISTSVTVTEVT